MEKLMKLFRGIAAGLCLTAACVLAAPMAQASQYDKKTVVTFSEPLEIPGGQILPAGTYVFKILDSPSDRHIVQISNQAEDHLFATILSIPNFRLKATDKTVMTFRERPEGQPAALRAWFYPGREWGEQFVYEKSRAIELAKESNEPVLATPVAMASAPVETLTTAPVEAVGPAGDTVDTADVVEAPPATPVVEAPAAPVQVADATPPPAPVQAADATPAPAPAAALPQTASSLPLIGLLGLLTLGVGLALGGLLKRVG
jgi:hypothetical protein